MEVTDRVHVAAHGWEVARLVEPLFELKADKLVLICPMDDAYLAAFEHDMIADLEAMERLELELRRADFYDLDSSVQAFTQAVKDHEGDEVYINISTGTNVAAIAGMMAAQTSDATPYYVTPTLTHEQDIDESEDVWTPEEPIFENAGEISELPVFELQGPSSEQLQVMGFLLGKEGVTKKELIRFAESEELPFIATTEAKTDEGRYRLLESHIIDPLTDGGYVRVEKAGRKKNVFLEQRGVDALAAFPLDDDTVETVETAESDGIYGPPFFPTLPDRQTTSSDLVGYRDKDDDSE
jgi:hypothetical protein